MTTVTKRHRQNRVPEAYSPHKKSERLKYMPNQALNTNFPLHVSLSTYEWSPGEQALISSSLFCKYGLSLYCGVLLCDLEYADGGSPWDEHDDRYLMDYLICQGDNVIMSIQVTDRDQWRGEPLHLDDLCFAEISAAQMECADIVHILTTLESLLQRDEPAVWQCCIREVPREYIGRLEEGQLLELQDSVVQPTEYGMCMGLVRVLSSTQHTTLCSCSTAEYLMAMLDNCAQRNAIHLQFPFAQRIEALSSGVYCSAANGAKVVREMKDLPLVDYLHVFPKELETLRRLSPKLCGTYGEAACMIYDMIHSGHKPTVDNGVTLLKALAVPPVVHCDAMASVQSTSHAYFPAPSGPDRQRAGLEARVNRLMRSVSLCTTLSFVTMKSFFQGVGFLAQTGYPDWLAGALQTAYELPDEFIYARFLCHGYKLLQQEDDAQEGLRLLYLLMIEPFQLIRQNSSPRRKEASNP